MDEIDDIKRRLSVLEKESSTVQPTKPAKKKSDYQLHMSHRLNELKNEADSKGVIFDRKQAFSQAAREWTANKNK